MLRTMHRLCWFTLLLANALPLPVHADSTPAPQTEEILRGPHPFIKENEVAFHVGYSAGLGEAPSGVRVQGDYLSRLGRVPWLDIQMGILVGSCRAYEASCKRDRAADILGGIAWRFQSTLPIVPYLKSSTGPVFLLSRDGSAFGWVVRGGAGAHYYPYDWFGLGVELTAAWGVAVSDTRSMSLGSIDANLGAAVQF
jgi:hypothetical protein